MLLAMLVIATKLVYLAKSSMPQVFLVLHLTSLVLSVLYRILFEHTMLFKLDWH